jgi:hypothetical protein
VSEPLDPQRIFKVLERHDVEYILIGGLAAVLHGSALVTNDADICPRRTPKNLEHLAAALGELDARLRARGDAKGVGFTCDAAFLGGVDLLTLETAAGQFDIAFAPAGFASYEALVDSAVTYDIDGTRVQVAALRDVIHSKETANRVKDQAALPHLYALEDEIAAGESGSG